MKKLYILLLLLTPFVSIGQEIAIKTNTIGWAMGAMNIAGEIGVGKRVTMSLTGNYSPFMVKPDVFMKYWNINPEIRLWFCEKFYGHFLGASASYGEFDVSGIPYPGFSYTKNNRYEGKGVSLGLTYGYQWPISKRWNMEFTIGYGFSYSHSSSYIKGPSGAYRGSDTDYLLVPTKLGLNFVYLLR